MRVGIVVQAAVIASLVGMAGCNNASAPGLSGGLGAGDASQTAMIAGAGENANANSAGSSYNNPMAPPQTRAPGGRQVIKNPTLEDVLAKGKLPEFTLGRADAPVTVIKYASLTCPYCRQFHKTQFPQLKRELIDTGKIRFIIREFPIGQSSGNATIALRCTSMDKYLDLYGKFLDQQANWVSQDVRIDKIYAVAQQVGMKRSQFDACLKNQGMINDLQWVKDRGRTLGIIGTPNFFIQNKLYKKQLTVAEIKEAIAQVQNGSAVAARN